MGLPPNSNLEDRREHVLRALALEKCAAQARNTDAEKRAAEIRIHAELQAGKLLKATKKAKAGRPKKNRSSGTTNSQPTLADLGISKDQSSKWQQLATGERKVRKYLREEAGTPTTAGALRAASKWSDKAAALASYAKQAKDDTLMKHAMRIQSRAILRAGELLEQIEPQANQHSAKAASGPSRKQAAKEAGLSERQRKTALRVAKVPKDEFDKLVESDNPPTSVTDCHTCRKD